MRAGTLRHQVTVQAYGVNSANDYGELTPNYSAGIVRWASIEPLSGIERDRAMGVVGEVTHKITIRSHGADECKAEDRIAFDARTFNVVSVLNPDEIGERLEILAKELV